MSGEDGSNECIALSICTVSTVSDALHESSRSTRSAVVLLQRSAAAAKKLCPLRLVEATATVGSFV